MIKDDNLYTKQGVVVTKLINQGKTKAFEDYEEADMFAKATRSYTYTIFDSEGYCAGWGVPR